MYRQLSLITALGLLSACATVNDAPHAGHVAHLDHVEPDAQGRQLYDTRHDMDAEMLAELRSRDVFAGYTDEQLTFAMNAMGPNYTWLVSEPGARGKLGVLVLAHGFGDHGDAVLRQQLQTLATEEPTALALGMSMMTSDHIQLALDDLTAAGVREIVVVPVVSTRTNSLMRQWDYIFGRSDSPEYGRVPQVSTRAKLRLADPPDDNPLVGAMLLEHALQISQNPSREEVIIVGHGPVDPADNLEQLELMENLANYVRNGAEFAAVRVATLQDDAPREVRMARIRELREMVAQANLQGRNVLIVTNLLGTRIVQSSLRRNLRGLNYRFNPQGLIENPLFLIWLEESVAANTRLK